MQQINSRDTTEYIKKTKGKSSELYIYQASLHKYRETYNKISAERRQ
jgi:hypothetical protein